MAYWYELRDVDEQAEEYSFILTVFTPIGPETHAVDTLGTNDEGKNYLGLAENGELVVSFSSFMPFTLMRRNRCRKLSSADVFERALETESEMKIYKSRRGEEREES